MKVFFIRHGQSEANVGKFHSGQSDVKLTELGKEQAKAIAPILESITFDRVYTSDLSRAVDTQQLALKDAKVDLRSPMIREYNVGSIERLPHGTVNVLNSNGDRDYTPYGGENHEMVISRLKEFLQKYIENDNCKNVAIFTHYGVMNAMMNLLIGKTSHFIEFPINNCYILVFEYLDGKWSLFSFNYGVKLD